MFRHAFLVVTIVALTGCTADIGGYTIGIKKSSTLQSFSTSLASNTIDGAAVRFSDASSLSIQLSDISTSAEPVKIAVVGVEENGNIKRFVPFSRFDASDTPQGSTPILVKKASENADLFTRVLDQQSAEFVWYTPKPILFDANTVSARLGSANGFLLPVPQLIGSSGLGQLSLSSFAFQFPVNATGDLEVRLAEGYAYVHRDQQSNQMTINRSLVIKDYRGSSQRMTASIDFKLADQAGKPIYGLSRSDFNYAISGPSGTYFEDGSFSEVSSGSYRISIRGEKKADQQNLVSLKISIPKFGTSTDHTQSL